MKTTITISLEKELKEDFTLFSRTLWTNPTNLINMLMKNAMNRRRVEFETPKLDIEIEPFSEAEIKSLWDNVKIQEWMKKLEKLLAHA